MLRRQNKVKKVIEKVRQWSNIIFSLSYFIDIKIISSDFSMVFT